MSRLHSVFPGLPLPRFASQPLPLPSPIPTPEQLRSIPILLEPSPADTFEPRFVINRARTYTVVGGSKPFVELTPEQQTFLAPSYQVIQTVAKRLSDQGYAVLTGGCPGIPHHAAWAAAPENSYVIHVSNPDWLHLKNDREGQAGGLYRPFASVDTGVARTQAFNRNSRVMIVAPGGIGTLEEIAVTLNNMYYGLPDAPDFVVFLDRQYYGALDRLFNQMIQSGMAKDRLKDKYAFVDVAPDRLEESVQAVMGYVTGALRPQQNQQPTYGNLLLRA
ncbi:MAG: LOG family protein [Candidatus Melainabacteria bacterium]|nr:LOG family protein [Candidatus Melainabacteria bacterium]